MTQNSWIKQTEYIQNFEIVVYFLVQKDFYFGDSNNPQQIEDENFREALYAPLGSPSISASGIEINLDEMIKHYASVFAMAKKHNKKIEQYYFWLCPYIKNIDANELLSNFPWYENLENIKDLFKQLRNEKDGKSYSDSDQSWQLLIEKQGDKIHIKESDPDEEEEEIYCQINLDRNELLRQADVIEEKTELAIKKLVAHFGVDYWTKYICP